MAAIALIPARVAATRLPGKPLADIAGVPMIIHVWRRAMEAQIGPVAVATDSEDVAMVVRSAGGTAVLTSEKHQSGSDRIFEALAELDPTQVYDVVVNIQGDIPTIDPAIIRAAVELLDVPEVQVGTLGALIRSDEERNDPNVVKVVGSFLERNRVRALYFTRATAPSGEGELIHHIGLYAWRRSALARFVELSPSRLETREKLEQLRAIEAGMRIDVKIVDDVPLGVDGPQDLERARRVLAVGYRKANWISRVRSECSSRQKRTPRSPMLSCAKP